MNPAPLGALLAFAAVALGAFGTHALRDTLPLERLATFETGVRYQMYHGLGLLALGALPRRTWRAAPLLFGGTLLFSGSLYLLALTGIRALGAITPLGGLAWIAAWALLALRVRVAI